MSQHDTEPVPIDQLAVACEMEKRWIDRRFDALCERVAKWNISFPPREYL